jgi:pimeloyl-ACP methyl ester carboxylesterase
LLHHKIIQNTEHNEWVVMLHAVGGSYHTFYKQEVEFQRHFNLLMIDLPGHGGSSDIQNDTEEDLFVYTAKQVLQIMNDQGIPKAHFVGVSLGTIIIHKIMHLDEAKVQSACLGSALTGFEPTLLSLANRAWKVRSLIPYMMMFRFFGHRLLPYPNHKDHLQYFISQGKKMGRGNFYQWMNALRHVEEVFDHIEIKTIAIPRLYISGEEDISILPHFRRELSRNQYMDYTILKKCGHLCHMEKPEEFNQIALSFFLSQ